MMEFNIFNLDSFVQFSTLPPIGRRARRTIGKMTEYTRERIGAVIGSDAAVPGREGEMEADDEQSGKRGRGPRR